MHGLVASTVSPSLSSKRSTSEEISIVTGVQGGSDGVAVGQEESPASYGSVACAQGAEPNLLAVLSWVNDNLLLVQSSISLSSPYLEYRYSVV